MPNEIVTPRQMYEWVSKLKRPEKSKGVHLLTTMDLWEIIQIAKSESEESGK
jgi:hypothetical protein